MSLSLFQRGHLHLTTVVYTSYIYGEENKVRFIQIYKNTLCNRPMKHERLFHHTFNYVRFDFMKIRVGINIKKYFTRFRVCY